MQNTVISECGYFEWDPIKNENNKKKHGFTFDEILEIFEDPFLLTRFDTKNSTISEERYFTLGSIQGILIIAVSHTDRNGRTRIISARQAEPKLKKVYNEHIEKINS